MSHSQPEKKKNLKKPINWAKGKGSQADWKERKKERDKGIMDNVKIRKFMLISVCIQKR